MEPQEARLSDVIRAGHVATPIAQAEFINQGEDGAAAYSRLSSMRIDQAPVKHNNHIVGWAQTSWLEPQTRVKRPQHALGDSTLVAASAPFSQLLQVLGRSGLVFTVENGITGFVTPSDLERHAARTYFYLLISGIEMQLAALLQQTKSSPQWRRAPSHVGKPIAAPGGRPQQSNTSISTNLYHYSNSHLHANPTSNVTSTG